MEEVANIIFYITALCWFWPKVTRFNSLSIITSLGPLICNVICFWTTSIIPPVMQLHKKVQWPLIILLSKVSRHIFLKKSGVLLRLFIWREQFYDRKTKDIVMITASFQVEMGLEQLVYSVKTLRQVVGCPRESVMPRSDMRGAIAISNSDKSYWDNVSNEDNGQWSGWVSAQAYCCVCKNSRVAV